MIMLLDKEGDQFCYMWPFDDIQGTIFSLAEFLDDT